ncbi:extracellular solute-binding protein [Treponema sp. OttesenSCG-928-L16]|nr:extracellular solute-binding protein [Treponema sp. OttesenSCG-928-L16]
MMRKFLTVLVITLCITGLIWAGGKTETSSDTPPTALTVWSAAAEDEAAELAKAFSAHHPEINVSVIRLGSGELVTRLNAEQPRPQGDILLGIAKETFDGNYELFRGYKSANHAKIPENVRDKADPPRYYGFSMPLQAFIINTNLFTPAQYPKTWKDLTDPKYKGEIILSNPALSGSAYAQIYMVWKLYGDTVLKQLAENAVFVASSTAVPESVARGEYAVGVTGEGNIASYITQGAPVTYVYPQDGTGARFDATGIIKNGPNPKAAELFMDFITSEEAYSIILNVRSRRVVIPTLPGPGPLPALDEIVLTDYDAEEAAKLREELTTRFSDWIK